MFGSAMPRLSEVLPSTGRPSASSIVVTGSRLSHRPPRLAGSVLLGVALAEELAGVEATDDDGGELTVGFFDAAFEQPVSSNAGASAHASSWLTVRGQNERACTPSR